MPAGGMKPLYSAPGHLRGVLARDPSVCLAAVEVFSFSVPTRKRTKRTRNHVEAEAEVLTVGGEKPVDPALDRLHKRMALELEALRELLRKAELIPRRPACKGSAAPAGGKSKRLLAPEPRMEAGGKTPSLKKRKVSPLLEQKHDQKQRKAPRMSPDEREQLAGRLASLAAVPDQIVEFLQQQFGSDADPQGEIEIDIHSVEESVLFELKARLDKLAEERLAADIVVPEQGDEDVDICAGSDSDSDSSSSSSDSDESSSGSGSGSESDSDEGVDGPAPPAVLPGENGAPVQPPREPAPEAAQSTNPMSVSGDGGGCTAPPALLPETAQPPPHRASEVAQSAEPKKKVQDVQRAAAPKAAVCLPSVLFRAKVRRELLKMERAVPPDESINQRDLRRLCIAEYGRPSVMRQLGLFLIKADA
ncbi:hypothetical protein SETIT_1G224400v2 [Setaria italica]|uniref:NET domain-containing protein n=1 Tax=Setaria italica TaxID=4555 RepID=K3Z0N5_SETIT|nr:histone-lysine N-methyltransferase SETD1A [Setaria italica]RCV07186.1 hypothetical protein SETIT_1G224400v2 [Setaria italica]